MIVKALVMLFVVIITVMVAVVMFVVAEVMTMVNGCADINVDCDGDDNRCSRSGGESGNYGEDDGNGVGDFTGVVDDRWCWWCEKQRWW